MTDYSTNQPGGESTTQKSSGKWWKYGCGIGCGGILIIIIILVTMGYYLIKDTVEAFKETEKVTKALISQYGEPIEYCPPTTGPIPTERLEIFLTTREKLLTLTGRTEEALNSIITDIREAEQDGKSSVGAITLIKKVAKLLPQLANYFTTRNQTLLDEGMGLGEYYYIYVIAYYSYLGHSPTAGPDFSFLEDDSQSRTWEYVFKEMATDKEEKEKKEYKDADTWEDEDIGSPKRVRGFILPMMKCQLKTLKSEPLDEETETWAQQLETEITSLENNRLRMPWQDNLPEKMKTSLQSYETRLKNCYSNLMNPLEFGLSSK